MDLSNQKGTRNIAAEAIVDLGVQCMQRKIANYMRYNCLESPQLGPRACAEAHARHGDPNRWHLLQRRKGMLARGTRASAPMPLPQAPTPSSCGPCRAPTSPPTSLSQAGVAAVPARVPQQAARRSQAALAGCGSA